MTTYARLNAGGTVERLTDLTAEQYALLEANGKAAWLRLWIVDAQPIPSATQVVEPGPITITATEAHQTWTLRDKTAVELNMEQNATESTQIKAMIANLTTSIQLDRSPLTAAQKIAQLEQDAVRLSRIARYYLRSLA